MSRNYNKGKAYVEEVEYEYKRTKATAAVVILVVLLVASYFGA